MTASLLFYCVIVQGKPGGKNLKKYRSVPVYFILLLLFATCTPPERVRYAEKEKRPPVPSFQGHKRLLAVMDFKNKTRNRQTKIASAVADKIISELAKTRRFTLLERQKIETILAEQTLTQAGVISRETEIQTGKLLGVQALVTGSLLEFDQRTEGGKIGPKKKKWEFALKASIARVTISYKLVDTITGEILFADRVSRNEFKPGLGFKTKEYDFSNLFELDQTLLGKALRKAVAEIANKISQQATRITWFGKVIRVKNELVYFTPGKNAAIKNHELFEVQSRGDEDDNQEISENKAIIRVVGFIGDQVAKAELLRGENIEAGDWVLEYRGPRN